MFSGENGEISVLGFRVDSATLAHHLVHCYHEVLVLVARSRSLWFTCFKITASAMLLCRGIPKVADEVIVMNKFQTRFAGHLSNARMDEMHSSLPATLP